MANIQVFFRWIIFVSYSAYSLQFQFQSFYSSCWAINLIRNHVTKFKSALYAGTKKPLNFSAVRKNNMIYVCTISTHHNWVYRSDLTSFGQIPYSYSVWKEKHSCINHTTTIVWSKHDYILDRTITFDSYGKFSVVFYIFFTLSSIQAQYNWEKNFLSDFRNIIFI